MRYLFLLFILTACQTRPKPSAEEMRREILAANPCPSTGPIADPGVKQGLNGLTTEFRKCYLEKMKQKKNVNGRVCLSWDISKSGAVEKLQLISVERNQDRDDDRDEALLQCLQAKMRMAKLPTPTCRPQPCVVRYPISFVNE